MVGHLCSSHLPICTGAPQRSVLPPAIFLFINCTQCPAHPYVASALRFEPYLTNNPFNPENKKNAYSTEYLTSNLSFILDWGKRKFYRIQTQKLSSAPLIITSTYFTTPNTLH